MGNRGRIYRRTESGRRALESERSGLPAGFRRILGLLENEIATAEFLREVREFPIAQVLDWLDQLETLGFIEATPRSDDSQSRATLLSEPFHHAA